MGSLALHTNFRLFADDIEVMYCPLGEGVMNVQSVSMSVEVVHNLGNHQQIKPHVSLWALVVEGEDVEQALYSLRRLALGEIDLCIREGLRQHIERVTPISERLSPR